MTKITAYNLVRAINNLSKDRNYNYISLKNRGLIRIDSVRVPAGPIHIRRWDPAKGKTYETAKVESISKEMLWRVANAINEGDPINFDRVLGASYNTRSVLETLIALTPEFYYCYPGRIMDVDGRSTIEHGHKHLVWLPNEPHQNGVLTEKQMENMAISEIPFQQVSYDNLVLPDNVTVGGNMDINVARRHAQIQIALYLIGLQLGYRVWIAQNDRGIIYNGTPLLNQPGVINSLSTENLISPFNAENDAKFIDCIWFQNGRFMPAVLEVEHTTGVTPGLTRMKGLQDKLPPLETRYVIVAPDEAREKVIEEANRPQFRSLDTRFFPYSAVEELYYICARRKLRGVSQEFLDCYMEKVLVS